MVIVHIAAVEICHKPVERSLVLPAEPAYEFLAGILREGPVPVYRQDSVHDCLDRPQGQDSIDYGSYRAGNGAHQVGGSECPVAQATQSLFPGLRTVFDACGLYHVAYMHVRRAGHLAALAVQAVFQCIVEECRILEPVPFSVRAGLLWAGIVRIHFHHRAYQRAQITLQALFQINRSYAHIPL